MGVVIDRWHPNTHVWVHSLGLPAPTINLDNENHTSRSDGASELLFFLHSCRRRALVARKKAEIGVQEADSLHERSATIDCTCMCALSYNPYLFYERSFEFSDFHLSSHQILAARTKPFRDSDALNVFVVLVLLSFLQVEPVLTLTSPSFVLAQPCVGYR